MLVGIAFWEQLDAAEQSRCIRTTVLKSARCRRRSKMRP
jgi:hypothetical protein